MINSSSEDEKYENPIINVSNEAKISKELENFIILCLPTEKSLTQKIAFPAILLMAAAIGGTSSAIYWDSATEYLPSMLYILPDTKIGGLLNEIFARVGAVGMNAGLNTYYMNVVLNQLLHDRVTLTKEQRSALSRLLEDPTLLEKALNVLKHIIIHVLSILSSIPYVVLAEGNIALLAASFLAYYAMHIDAVANGIVPVAGEFVDFFHKIISKEFKKKVEARLEMDAIATLFISNLKEGTEHIFDENINPELKNRISKAIKKLNKKESSDIIEDQSNKEVFLQLVYDLSAVSQQHDKDIIALCTRYSKDEISIEELIGEFKALAQARKMPKHLIDKSILMIRKLLEAEGNDLEKIFDTVNGVYKKAKLGSNEISNVRKCLIVLMKGLFFIGSTICVTGYYRAVAQLAANVIAHGLDNLNGSENISTNDYIVGGAVFFAFWSLVVKSGVGYGESLARLSKESISKAFYFENGRPTSKTAIWILGNFAFAWLAYYSSSTPVGLTEPFYDALKNIILQVGYKVTVTFFASLFNFSGPNQLFRIGLDYMSGRSKPKTEEELLQAQAKEFVEGIEKVLGKLTPEKKVTLLIKLAGLVENNKLTIADEPKIGRNINALFGMPSKIDKEWCSSEKPLKRANEKTTLLEKDKDVEEGGVEASWLDRLGDFPSKERFFNSGSDSSPINDESERENKKPRNFANKSLCIIS